MTDDQDAHARRRGTRIATTRSERLCTSSFTAIRISPAFSGPMAGADQRGSHGAGFNSIVTRASERLGFRVEHLRGRRTFAIELGNESLVDSLPGVPGGIGVRRHLRSRGGGGREHPTSSPQAIRCRGDPPSLRGCPIGRIGQLELIVPENTVKGWLPSKKTGRRSASWCSTHRERATRMVWSG